MRSLPALGDATLFMSWRGRLWTALGSARPLGAQSGHQVGVLGLDDPVPAVEVHQPDDRVELVVEDVKKNSVDHAEFT